MNRLFFLYLLIIASLFSCNKSETEPFSYRQEMRKFVQGISQYTRSFESDFIVIPQNGIELIMNSPEIPGDLNMNYLDAINGNGQEDLNYGYFADDIATPASVTNYLNPLLAQAISAGKTVLVTDYCYSMDKMGKSYNLNNSQNYISFSAESRELDVIPYFPKQPFKVNSNNIMQLSEAKNFLYLINTHLFSSKEMLVDSLSKTNYDILILDLFFQHGESFNTEEIHKLKIKANGGNRLVVCYMSIGEAEDYRYYWKKSWEETPPEWLGEENPYWPGNYLVRYWYPDWQEIIYGNNTSYAKLVIDAGFDGLYLDLVDAFEYFE